MAKIDLDSLNIEELAALRDAATEKLAQKVMARQAELEAELEQLAQYGKLAKKALVAPPVTKPKKAEQAGRKAGEEKDTVAEAA
jgi:DNA-binding protein H-NS